MSARTPFVPTGAAPRPASRPDSVESSKPTSNPQFVPDASNPLHMAKSASLKHTDKQSTANTHSNDEFVPLPMTGLVKKSSRPSSGLGTPKTASRQSSHKTHSQSGNDNQVQNNRNPKGSLQSNNHTLTTLAPNHSNSPFNPSRQFSSAFKSTKTPIPSSQNATTAHSDEISVSDAHISTMTDTGVTQNQYQLNVTKMNSGPPQRVPIQSGRSSMTQDDDLRATKRSRAEFDDDDDDVAFNPGYSNPKRFKNSQTEAEINPMDYNCAPCFPSRMSSPIAPSHHSDYRPSPDVSYRHSSHVPDFMQNEEMSYEGMYTPQANEELSGSQNGPGALDKLLSRDSNLYVEENMEKYEQMAAKWRECTMEEWVAGAEEISQKYTRLLEFVKDHMTTKLNLFSSFTAQIDEHNKVLGEREKVLATVKEKLVKDSGSILGSS